MSCVRIDVRIGARIDVRIDVRNGAASWLLSGRALDATALHRRHLHL